MSHEYCYVTCCLVYGDAGYGGGATGGITVWCTSASTADDAGGLYNRSNNTDI
jgi:hypothetical protein